MSDNTLIGILGGTFDPVHNHHITIARYCINHLPFDSVRFLPCKLPLLKAAPTTSAQQRLDMLTLAIADYPGLLIDERELVRDTPSYMVDSLRSLREEYPNAPLVLILGTDAFNQLNEWHEWQSLFLLAHLLVIQRTDDHDAGIPAPLKLLVEQRQVDTIADLQASSHGKLFFAGLAPRTVASRDLREQIQQGIDISDKVPLAVIDYIVQHKLYQ